MAWLLGFLASDGTVSSSDNTIKICLSAKDKEVLEKIKEEVEIENKIVEYTTNNGFDCVDLHWTCAEHKKDLANYGITPNKTFTIKPPLGLKEEFYIDFIRGYFDGDGSLHCSKNGKTASFVSTYDFCMTAKKVIEKELNIHCSVYQYYDNGITSTLQISGGKQVPQFLSWIYDNCDLKLERKYLKYLEYFVA